MLTDNLELLAALGILPNKTKPKKNNRYQQKDEKGYVVFLDGFWSKGRAHELIDAKGVGHYYEGGWSHGCNGSCAREDFMMAAELDRIDNDVVKYIKEYGMDSVFEEVKIKYAER